MFTALNENNEKVNIESASKYAKVGKKYGEY